MFKGLYGLKKAVKGGFNVVVEQGNQLAEQVVDPSSNRRNLQQTIKEKVQGISVASVVEPVDQETPSSNYRHDTERDKVSEYAHNIKHYGAFGEDYLGFSDPTKDLRKAVKQREKAARKARKEKKKTGKKEDLFDPENLAKFKKELEEKRKKEETDVTAFVVASEEISEQKGLLKETSFEDRGSNLDLQTSKISTDIPIEEKEEWKTFQSLTSGIDSLIKKTQEGLYDIKKDSLYTQKNVVDVKEKGFKAEKENQLKKKKNWVNLDSASFDEYNGELEQKFNDNDEREEFILDIYQSRSHKQKETEEKTENDKNTQLKEQEEKFDHEDDDEIFNTEYVNAITSGEVKFTAIPDIFFENDKDDPFKTDFAEVFIKEQEEERKKERDRIKFDGLSVVVDVLSGKVGKVDKSVVDVAVKKKRRRANRINLIGEELAEVTALEDIHDQKLNEIAPDIDILTLASEKESAKLNSSVLVSTPSPCPCLFSNRNQDRSEEDKESFDLSDFEVLGKNGRHGDVHLTSNVAILSGEFPQETKQEEDDFDAAFDALAKKSVTKAHLEQIEKEFQEDDIFDTSTADKILGLVSLTNKIEDIQEEDFYDFEDPFDTTSYENITGKVQTDLEFESIANRENNKTDIVPDQVSSKSLFGSISVIEEGWAAFEEKKPPPRPAPPNKSSKGTSSSPPLSTESIARPQTPSVVVKAPSSESIKSWNISVVDALVKDSDDKEAGITVQEIPEETDPFDTSEFHNIESHTIGNFKDPFDTSKVELFFNINKDKEGNHRIEDQEKLKESKQEEESETEEEEVPDPFEVLTIFDKVDVNVSQELIKPLQHNITLQETDPFDTNFASKVLPNKGDPFDTSFISGALGKAELKALEDELLRDNFRSEESFDLSKRTRPKPSGQPDISRIVPVIDGLGYDPFDTSIAEQIICGNKHQNKPVLKAPREGHFEKPSSFERNLEN